MANATPLPMAPFTGLGSGQEPWSRWWGRLLGRTPGRPDRVAELSDLVHGLERVVREQADRLGGIRAELADSLNAQRALVDQAQQFVDRLTTAEADGERLNARTRALEEALEQVLRPPPELAPPPSPAGWSAADRRWLEDRGLFVVGTARSAATVLFEALNESPDIYLLGEAMLFEEAHRPDFADAHERRHAGYGNRKHKGHYLPRGLAAAGTGFDALRRLADRYRWVGEKVAFGPWHVTDRDPGVYDRFVRFHATHFFHSRYLSIVRRPVLGVASMLRLWGQFAVPQLLATWAAGFRVGVELAVTFPNVWVVAHENLNERTAARLGERLAVDIDVPAGRFDREFQKSAGAADRLPPRLEPHRADLDELTGLYDEWVGAFCPDSFRYTHREASRPLAARLCDRADAFMRRMQMTVEQANRPVGFLSGPPADRDGQHFDPPEHHPASPPDCVRR